MFATAASAIWEGRGPPIISMLPGDEGDMERIQQEKRDAEDARLLKYADSDELAELAEAGSTAAASVLAAREDALGPVVV